MSTSTSTIEEAGQILIRLMRKAEKENYSEQTIARAQSRVLAAAKGVQALVMLHYALNPVVEESADSEVDRG